MRTESEELSLVRPESRHTQAKLLHSKERWLLAFQDRFNDVGGEERGAENPSNIALVDTELLRYRLQ